VRLEVEMGGGSWSGDNSGGSGSDGHGVELLRAITFNFV